MLVSLRFALVPMRMRYARAWMRPEKEYDP